MPETNPNTSGIFRSQEPRSHNRANELIERDTDGSGGQQPLDLSFDAAGNLREEETGTGSTKLIYTHDAWNRLVKVEYEDDQQQTFTRGEYSYNGLHWRIRRTADTDTNGTLDQERLMYYSANWQLLEEDVDDDLDQTVDRHVQYVWGVRYIDDIVMRREDRNNDDDYIDPEDIERYYLTDVQFSVVAILDEAAEVIERISYSPYGEARHHRMSDLNGDGASTRPDKTIIQNNDGNFGAGDLDRDGTVEYSGESGDDWLIADADVGLALSAGVLSSADELGGLLLSRGVSDSIAHDEEGSIVLAKALVLIAHVAFTLVNYGCACREEIAIENLTDAPVEVGVALPWPAYRIASPSGCRFLFWLPPDAIWHSRRAAEDHATQLPLKQANGVLLIRAKSLDDLSWTTFAVLHDGLLEEIDPVYVSIMSDPSHGLTVDARTETGAEVEIRKFDDSFWFDPLPSP